VSLKALFSLLAVVVSLMAFAPYITGIIKGRLRPHVFSWVIWTLTTSIVFFAQMADGAGVGAWPIGFSAILALLIASLAYRHRGVVVVARSDWLFFGLALSALPVWALTSNPMWAVIILTSVDLLGFAPTWRKTYWAPHGESVVFFGLTALRCLLIVLALEHYSIATALFPVMIGLAASVTLSLALWRRRVVPHTPPQTHTTSPTPTQDAPL
jgi:hypothetical protein